MTVRASDISFGSVQFASVEQPQVEPNSDKDEPKGKKIRKRLHLTKEDFSRKNINKRIRGQLQKTRQLSGLGNIYLPGAFVSLGGGQSAVLVRELNFRAGMGIRIGFMPFFRAITANVGAHIVFDVRRRPDFFEDKKLVRTASGIQPSVTLSYLEINFPILNRMSDDEFFSGDPQKTKGLGICAAMPLTYGLLSFCAESFDFFGQRDSWTFSGRLGW